MSESMKTEPASNQVAQAIATPKAIKARSPGRGGAPLRCWPGSTALHPPPTGRNEGFTLIEVLIAMVVLSISIISYLGMQGSSITGNANARRLSASSTWASNRIEHLLSESYASIANGNDANGDMSMTWTVTKDSPITNTKSIAVTVTNTSTVPQQTVTINFIKSDTF